MREIIIIESKDKTKVPSAHIVTEDGNLTVSYTHLVIADIIALLQSPAKNVISALQSGGNTIHGVLKTLGERAE